MNFKVVPPDREYYNTVHLPSSIRQGGWSWRDAAKELVAGTLQRLIENPLALRLLEGDFAEGDTIRVDAQNAELAFTRAEAAAAAA